MRLGIFTKQVHVEKIVNYLNSIDFSDYFISTSREEIMAYNFDIGISYCFPYILKGKELEKAKWYNFHPALLPKYKGKYNYADAIKDGVLSYGVALHEIDEGIDTGKLITIKKFSLTSKPINSNELGNITHYYLFQLFKETIKRFITCKDCGGLIDWTTKKYKCSDCSGYC